jgi:asparagine synthase (glutamine-hydrolysing)
MCGIAGAVWGDPASAVDSETLNRMGQALRHRGPDDQDHYIDQRAGLVHRRLSIIDLSTGRQPLCNEDGTVWIVFNGEIYNFLELRRRLESRGHKFRTATDTEAIVHLYEDEGLDCLSHLRGMFAIALWDTKRQRLLLARDRLGKKPLTYTLESGRLAFASEIKALLEVPGISREIDAVAMDQYFTLGYVPQPRTIFRGISKLPPGHYGVYEDGQLRIKQYWAPGAQPEEFRSEEEFCEQLRAEVTEATRLRLISDVPLGAFLSGGIDSTIIVGLMQQFSDRPTKTFSIGFSVKELDESRYARLSAQHLGTEHHEFLVQHDCLDVLPDLISCYDEPFADSSALPTYYLSKLTRQHVTVALTGDGGDEVFCGYLRYQKLRQVNRFDRVRPIVRALAGEHRTNGVSRVQPAGPFAQRAQTFLELLALEPADRYARIAAVSFRGALRTELYEPDLARKLADEDPLAGLREAYDRFATRDPVSRAMLADQLTYLPGDILTKVDIASMAHGLECRSPFLDQQVVEIANRMPISLKLCGNLGKYILRKTFADLVPRENMDRRKMGFVVPLKRWFRSELKEYVKSVLLDPATLGRGYFRPDVVRRMIEEHIGCRRDHSMRIWALLCFEMWHRRFVDSACPSPVSA